MSEPQLTESAKKALAAIIKLLEDEGFNGEIRVVAAQRGVRELLVTTKVKV